MPLQTITILLAMTAAHPVIDTPARELELFERGMTVDTARDPITDAVRTFAVAHSREGHLAIGCDPDRFDGLRVQFISNSWFAGENFVTRAQFMRYRFDEARPRRSRWSVEEQVASLRPLSHVPSFIDWVLASDRLAIRTRDIEDREGDIIFALHGAETAIPQMLEACGTRLR